MSRRGISENDVAVVYENPTQKIRLETGREIWQNKIVIEGKMYVLRVVMELAPVAKIVTVYKSSKIKKYWKEES